VLNVHAPTEDKIDDMKDVFYEELEHVFDKFPRYHMKILLGDFNVKVGREDIFKPTIGSESLHENINDNGVRVVNFATSKNLTTKDAKYYIVRLTWT
jgi:exonuclease III